MCNFGLAHPRTRTFQLAHDVDCRHHPGAAALHHRPPRRRGTCQGVGGDWVWGSAAEVRADWLHAHDRQRHIIAQPVSQ